MAGDFSRWPAIYEYKINRARAESLRRGKSELVRALVKDADGNFKTFMRPIYTRELEHVEKLKVEKALELLKTGLDKRQSTKEWARALKSSSNWAMSSSRPVKSAGGWGNW